MWKNRTLFEWVYTKSKSINNKCKRCGRDSHTEIRCYAKVDVDGYYIKNDSSDNRKTHYCKRCGRNTHTEINCYAKVDVDGYYIGIL
jgi:ribosomal protein S14